MYSNRRSKHTFAGLFSGCGGFDRGFELAGFRSIGAFDNDPSAVDTYNSNLSGKAIVCDLSKQTSLSLPSRPDVIIAGPPCQGFSTLGLRQKADPRNSLLIRAAELATLSKPQVIMLENVLGAIAGTHVDYWNSAKQILSQAGYKIREFRILGTDFGLPQIRRRVMLLASRAESIRLSLPIQPENTSILRGRLADVEQLPNHSPKVLTIGSEEDRIATRIAQNQKLCNVRRGSRSVPTWDIPEVFGPVTQAERRVLEEVQRLRRRLRLRSTGDADPILIQDLADLNINSCKVVACLLKKGYLRSLGERIDLTHAFNGKYRRLSWDHPTPTVDTRFGQPRYFLHPDENRGLSAREAARIQGFDDDFVFHGSHSEQFRHIGNAVPPVISKWFATEIAKYLL